MSSAICWLRIDTVTYGTLYGKTVNEINDSLKAKIKAINVHAPC